MKLPLKIEYKNDSGRDDDDFNQWWAIVDADGELVCDAHSEGRANEIVDLLTIALSRP